VIHAVSLDQARRTDSQAIDRAVRSAFARARDLGVETLAIPALGTGVGGFPMAEAARVTVAAVRSELARSPRVVRVTLALRGAAAYEAFRLALAAAEAAPAGVPA
jgi:O-acetyl-ADP-ribose deacetylase (regulator of RNase III)